MFFIWLIARNRQSYGTGPLDRYFTFLCALCGTSLPAMVRTLGYGTGPDWMAAQRSAMASADAQAFRAVSAVGCPHCAQLQPNILEGWRRAEAKVARRKSLRLPIALGLAVLIAIVLAIPAIRDLRHSVMLAVVAISTSAAVFGLLFGIFSSAVITPSTNPSGVWFSRDPSQQNSWFQAQSGAAPVVAQPSGAARALGYVTMGVTGVMALIALILWSNTFRKIYVVSSEGGRGDLVVRIDGAEAGHVKPTSNHGGDVPYEKFEVRTDAKHHVVVLDSAGKESAYDLDTNEASNGWAIAPNSFAHGLCVATITTYYGTAPKDDGNHLLNGKGDLIVLPSSFENIFEPPPKSVETKNGSSTTRTSLRGFDCAALEKENLVPYNSVAH